MHTYTHACAHTHMNTHACTRRHARIHAHMHIHTHTCIYIHVPTNTNRVEGQCWLTEIFGETPCFEFVFEGRIFLRRVPDVLVETAPDVGL